MLRMSAIASLSGASRQPRGDVAVDVDERLQLRRIRIDRHLDRLLHHEDADIGDLLAHVLGLGIFRGLRRAHEDGPEPPVEQQRLVHALARALPAVPDLLQLPCRLEQRLRFYFPGISRGLRRTCVGLSGKRHPSPRWKSTQDSLRLHKLSTSPGFKIWLLKLSVFVRIAACIRITKRKRREISRRFLFRLQLQISAAAAARSAGSGWRARARRPRSTAGSTAPGCWRLPRWYPPASGWTSRSAAR